MTTNLPTRKKIIEVTLNYYEWSNAETAHINPLQLNKSGMCGREFLPGNATAPLLENFSAEEKNLLRVWRRLKKGFS